MENKWLPIEAPTYVPIQAPKQEEPILGIVKLASYGVNLARTNPKKAEEFAKKCIVVGVAVSLVGLGIWALAKSRNQ